MGFRAAKTRRRRDPDNELYDCACALLQAAHELRAAAGLPGSAPAYPATLGCIEASLSALNESVGRIRARAAVTSASPALGALCHELDDAGRSAGAARMAVASLLTEARPD